MIPESVDKKFENKRGCMNFGDHDGKKAEIGIV